MTNGAYQVLPGITVSRSGEATVDPALADVLFDLALKLEEPLNLPVDVQHVVDALLLADRRGELAPDVILSADNQALVATLTPHVRSLFANYGGEVTTTD